MANCARFMTRTALTATILLAAATGHAEDRPATTNPPGEAETEQGVHDIVVTAQFRAQSLQDTPLAITAISGEGLIQRGASNVADVSRLAPNVNLAPSGSFGGKTTRAYIRGVGEGDFNFALEPGVAFYIDDTYLATAYGTLLDLVDLDRVEVLRGPQGTLFGKNSIGGAIRLISKRPEGSNTGYLELTTGSYKRIEARGAFDVALIPDVLSARVTAFHRKRDGYIKILDFACDRPGLTGNQAAPLAIKNSQPGGGCQRGTLANDDVSAARLAVRWTPSSAFEINLSGDYTDDDGNGAADTLIAVNENVFTNYNAAQAVPLYGVPYDSRFVPNSRYATYATFYNKQFGIDFKNTNAVRLWGLNGTAKWEIAPQLTLTSITSYRHYRGQFGRDSDSSPLSTDSTYDEVSGSQFSQEVRLSGLAFGDRLNWTTGGFYFDSRNRDAGVVTADLFNLRFTIDDPAGITNKSAFAHGEFEIVDGLKAIGGIRYTREQKFYEFNHVDLPGTPTPFFGAGGLHRRNSTSYNRFDWRAGLQYEPTRDIMVYGQVSTGFRGGGFNPRPATASQVTPFGPETLTSYEVGAKIEFLDRRVRLNTALFYSAYNDIQLSARLPDPDSSFPAVFRVNAGKARSQGAEAELTAQVTDGFSLNGTIGYTDFKYLDLGPAAGLSGGPTLTTKPVFTPKIKYNLGAQYVVPIGKGEDTLAFTADYSWQAHIFTDAANAAALRIGSYGVLNGRITANLKDIGLSVSVFGTNLTDKYYYYGTLYISGNGQIKGVPARPHEWGLSVKKTF